MHERAEVVNPFSTNFPLLYLQKTSGNLLFSDVFRGYKKSGTFVENGLIIIVIILIMGNSDH